MLISINFQKDHIYVAIFIIIYIIKYIIDNNVLRIEYFDNFYRFIAYISQICLFIFYIIENYLLINASSPKNEDNILENNYKITKIFSKKNILIILFMFSNLIDNYILNTYGSIKNEGNYITVIIFFILLEQLKFNNYIYPHHFLSIILILILFLLYIISNVIKSKYNLDYILYILSNYCYSLTILLIKYINTQYFINIFLLGSIHGCLELIQFLLNHYNTIFILPFNLYNIFIIILSFILMLITNFFFFIIISKLNPIHIFLINYIGNSIYLMNKFIFLDYIIFLLCIISSIIYLEILLLNFCDLNKGIKQNIIIRGKNEIISELTESNFNVEIENYNDSSKDKIIF